MRFGVGMWRAEPPPVPGVQLPSHLPRARQRQWAAS